VTIAFSEDKADALQELVNVGMGTAAGALATALGAFVELRVPRIEMVAPQRLVELLLAGPWGQRDFACIRQGFFAGARLRITGTTFIDEHPPAPTPIDEHVDRDTGRTR